MAKGQEAKKTLIEKFKQAAGDNYAGVSDDGKFWYFWSKEAGERVQLKVSLTLVKDPINFNGKGGDLNFTDDFSAQKPEEKPSITEDEKNTFERLIKELGLN